MIYEFEYDIDHKISFTITISIARYTVSRSRELTVTWPWRHRAVLPVFFPRDSNRIMVNRLSEFLEVLEYQVITSGPFINMG